MRSHNWSYQQNWYPTKKQDGSGRHIENYIFGHKSAIIAYICTEFDTEAETGSRSQIHCKNSHSAKIQDGGRRHFEIS